jgi:hypothetical protein
MIGEFSWFFLIETSGELLLVVGMVFGLGEEELVLGFFAIEVLVDEGLFISEASLDQSL